jgi:hypothetical protein
MTFDHLVDMPNSDCVFCSTRVKDTGRMKLFLIFNTRNSVYIRNGISEIWEEIMDQEASLYMLNRLRNVVQERLVPCYAIT